MLCAVLGLLGVFWGDELDDKGHDSENSGEACESEKHSDYHFHDVFLCLVCLPCLQNKNNKKIIQSQVEGRVEPHPYTNSTKRREPVREDEKGFDELLQALVFFSYGNS